jgi:hypothetical protein
MAPERIELTSGLAVEGLTSVSTVQVLHEQSTTSSGERSSGARKEPEKKIAPSDAAQRRDTCRLIRAQ